MRPRLIARLTLAACVLAAVGPTDAVDGAPRWLKGYARSLGGDVIGYQSPYPGPTPALLVRTTDGRMSVEWETEPLPADLRADRATFVFMAGLASGYGAHRFDLFVNGKPCCAFRSARDTSAREWTVTGAGGAELSFRTTLVGHFNEMFGFMFLTLPRAALTPGAPVRLKVVGEAAGSQDYFMAFEKPAASWLECRAEQALVRTPGGPARLVRVDVSHIAAPADIAIEAPGVEPVRGKLETGFNSFQLAVPGGDDKNVLDLTIVIGGTPAKEERLPLPAVRRRAIYLLPHAHVDIGYSDPQPVVERKHVENIRSALDLIRKTAGNPAEARFRWNVEVMWPVERFLAVASTEEKKQFADAVRSGSIGLQALFANELTGLCSPEELDRLTEYARRLGRELGVSVRSAMITDIPGASWNVVPAFARAGIRYFASGPNYMPFLPDRGDRVGGALRTWGDRPFWWVSPSGAEKILFWMAGRGYSWFHGMNAGKFGPEMRRPILDYMQELADAGYAYDMVQVNYTIGGDNGPTDPDLPDLVRQWNQEFDSPRIVIATTDQMFEAFERRHGAELPAFTGDFSPFWEDGAASTARETALNRSSARRLVLAETLFALLGPERFPAADFREAWRQVLLFDEHTWGAWNSVSDPDRPEVVAQWEYKRAMAVDADRRSRELLAVAMNGGRPQGAPVPAADGGGGSAIDIVNTVSWPRGGVVLISREQSAAGDRATDERGRVLPSQRLSSGELAVLVGDVPAFGARRVFVEQGAAPASGRAQAKANSLDNGKIVAEVDPRTGSVSRLTLRGTPDLEVAGPGGLNAYLYVAGRDPRQAQPGGAATVSVLDAGPLVAGLRVESPAPGARRLVRELRLAEGADSLEILDTLDKTKVRDKESVHFAFPFRAPEGVVRFALGEALVTPETNQLPGACKDFLAVHSSIDIANPAGGVTLTTLDAPLVEIGAMTDETQGARQVRAWRTAPAGGTTVYSYAMNNYWHTNYKADQEGVVVLRYTVRPHGSKAVEEIARTSLAAEQPLVCVAADSGSPVPQAPFAVTPPAVVVRSLQPAENGKGLVAQLYNASASSQRMGLLRDGVPLDPAFVADPNGDPGRRLKWPLEMPAFGGVVVWIPAPPR